MNSAQRIGVKSDTASIRHAAGQIWTGGDVEIQSHRYGAGWMAFGLACAKAGL